MTEVEIARVCHEVNRTLSQALGEFHPRWIGLSADLKQSTYDGMVAARDSDFDPEKSHESWCAEREKAGWKWGEVKSDKWKAHPNLRPYNQLPKEQQLKDHLFVAIVKYLS